MEILLNGVSAPLSGDTTLFAVLSGHRLKPEEVVVELNGRIVPRERFGVTRLSQGDKVEILHFVGGG